MSVSFPLNRYDGKEFTEAFKRAAIINHPDGSVFKNFAYGEDEIEVYFSDCESLPPDWDPIPVPDSLYEFAIHACQSIQQLDNLAQQSCEAAAKGSSFRETHYIFRIAYLKVYARRVHVGYWAVDSCNQWEAKFEWDSVMEDWVPLNF